MDDLPAARDGLLRVISLRAPPRYLPHLSRIVYAFGGPPCRFQQGTTVPSCALIAILHGRQRRDRYVPTCAVKTTLMWRLRRDVDRICSTSHTRLATSTYRLAQTDCSNAGTRTHSHGKHILRAYRNATGTDAAKSDELLLSWRANSSPSLPISRGARACTSAYTRPLWGWSISTSIPSLSGRPVVINNIIIIRVALVRNSRYSPLSLSLGVTPYLLSLCCSKYR